MTNIERRQPFVKAEVMYAVRDPSADVERMLDISLPVVDIPKRYLWGTQTKFEYVQRKERDIRKDFGNNPHLLDDHPIITCALPAFPVESEEDLQEIRAGAPYIIAVTDGHHRVRYSPRMLNAIPSRILTVEQTLVVHRNLGPHVKHHMGSDEPIIAAAKMLRSWVDETVRSFEDLERPLAPKRTATFDMRSGVPFVV